MLLSSPTRGKQRGRGQEMACRSPVAMGRRSEDGPEGTADEPGQKLLDDQRAESSERGSRVQEVLAVALEKVGGLRVAGFVSDIVRKERVGTGVSLFQSAAWIGTIAGYVYSGAAFARLGMIPALMTGSIFPPGCHPHPAAGQEGCEHTLTVAVTLSRLKELRSAFEAPAA